MFFEILTIFPSMFEGVFSDSIISRAVKNRLVRINIDNIRNYASGKHKVVDDYPYGGGGGMVFKPEPVAKAIMAARERCLGFEPKVIFLTPRGELLNQQIIGQLLNEKALIILCGRYKGIDERIRQKYVDREISIGDYVLSGGEIAAMVLVDAITRLIPGVLGNRDSAEKDSFYNGLLSAPEYTRPEIFEDMAVPSVLISGNHNQIEKWKLEQSVFLTKRRRPDLWRKYCKKNGIYKLKGGISGRSS